METEMPSASQPDRRKATSGLFLRGVVASGEVIARNPAIAGGTTAFLVSLFFVSANAMWYQPHFHKGAFFATRLSVHPAATAPWIRPSARPVEKNQPNVEPARLPRDNETTGAIAATGTQAQIDDNGETSGDKTVRQVQSVLKRLGLYDGAIDGLSGPQTHSSVENYQKIVGIDTNGEINDDVLHHLGIKSDTQASVPHPTPRPVRQASAEGTVAKAVETTTKPETSEQAQTAPEGDPRVVKIQAGLKAFGNDGIKLDGMAGEDTRKALKEFQSLFGLPATGKPDAKVVAKMKDIGLIN